MKKYFFVALLFLVIPEIVSACMPSNPYFYMVKGAYLLASLGFVVALVLELFRYKVEAETTRKILRRGVIGFVLFAVSMLLLAYMYGELEQNWIKNSPPSQNDSAMKRC